MKNLDTYTTLAKYITQYHRDYKTLSIDELCNIKTQIVCFSCNLAEETAQAKGTSLGAYFNRKISVINRTEEIIKSEVFKEIKNQTRAENMAKEELQDLYMDELDAQREAHKYELFLRQVNKVIEDITQRISVLKKEQFNTEYDPTT